MERKWKMKNGEKIWIRDMEDSHIINTLKMLQRNAWAHWIYNSEVALIALDSLQGEQAVISMEQELNKTWGYFLPDVYNSLVYYAKKRNFWNEDLEKIFAVQDECGYFTESPYWIQGKSGKI